MELHQIEPYVRFAASVFNGVMATAVKVTDCRIFFVEEGKLDIYIDGNCCSLQRNSLFYCPGGSIYRAQTHTDVRLICINFDLTRAWEQEAAPFPVCAKPEQWDSLQVNFEPVEDSSFLNSHLLISDAAFLGEHIRELTQVRSENTALSMLLCSSLLKSILLRMHRLHRETLPPKLAQVAAYIQKHYSQPLSNKELGQLVGYHEYYLNRIFQAHTGMNLHEYVIKIRMEQAAYLILNTALPLNVIAEQVGIRSYPHFSACFKEHFGCSPAKYRNFHI